MLWVLFMSGYIPCAGSGQNAVSLQRYPSQQNGLGMTSAKTFGNCPACGRTVMSHGLTMQIKITRHKAKVSDTG